MQTQSVTINFTGGIVSPGYLKEILETAQAAKIMEVRFGLRQQLIMNVPVKHFELLLHLCKQKNIAPYKSKEALPNILSSYPSAGILTKDSWLREGVYKDIFDLFTYTPKLKINICDSRQCFVPFFTGHINWISSSTQYFWHLYLRFPKTKKVYKWKEMVYTNDLSMLSQKIEQEILQDKFLFYDNEQADGNLLYQRVKLLTAYISKPPTEEPKTDFSLPYYEGFNKVNNQLWLGIYRRSEWFPVSFLKDVCTICMQTRIGQLYTTPWKSLIIKNIDSADRKLWDNVLGKYRVNVRHAANELNWQVEDFSDEGLQLKRHIIRHFDKEDVRTYGLCFAIQTKPTSSLFGSIVISKQQTKNPHRLKSLERYVIFYKKNFDPNAEELVIFREDIEKDHISTYLISLCKYFYERENNEHILQKISSPVQTGAASEEKRMLYQCKYCYTVYDPVPGDEAQGIPAGTAFTLLPSGYCCPLCEAAKDTFEEVEEKNVTIHNFN